MKGGAKEKRLAAQFIPKFFSSFPELADAAINAQLDLCEDEDVSVRMYTFLYGIIGWVAGAWGCNAFLLLSSFPQIRRQAIKELPRFAAGENLPRVADILTQLLQTGRSTLLLN